MYAKYFTYAGWASLFLLGIFEILAHAYSTHKETLTAAHEHSVKEADESRIKKLKERLEKQDTTVQEYLSSSETLRDQTKKNLQDLASEQKALSSTRESVESQRQSVEALAKRTERKDRAMTQEQAESLRDAMRLYAGQRFWVLIQTNDYNPNSEQMRLGSQLKEILKSAGWIEDGTIAKNLMYRPLTDSGVSIGFGADSNTNPKGDTVAKALSIGLSAIHIDSSLEPFSDISNGLLIDVGLR